MNRRTLLKSVFGLVASIPFMALGREKPAAFLGVDKAAPGPDETTFIYRIPTGKPRPHTILPIEAYAEAMGMGNLFRIAHQRGPSHINLENGAIIDFRYDKCREQK